MWHAMLACQLVGPAFPPACYSIELFYVQSVCCLPFVVDAHIYVVPFLFGVIHIAQTCYSVAVKGGHHISGGELRHEAAILVVYANAHTGGIACHRRRQNGVCVNLCASKPRTVAHHTLSFVAKLVVHSGKQPRFSY